MPTAEWKIQETGTILKGNTRLQNFIIESDTHAAYHSLQLGRPIHEDVQQNLIKSLNKTLLGLGPKVRDSQLKPPKSNIVFTGSTSIFIPHQVGHSSCTPRVPHGVYPTQVIIFSHFSLTYPSTIKIVILK